MSVPLRVLILEDRPADAELVIAELRRAGFDLDYQRVDTEADYLARLDPALDIILADYSLPQWDAPRALRAVQERGLDIPFIMLSGTVGEDVAVQCMKQGAVDYLLKDRLGRLGQAVMKALEDKRLRVEKQQAEAALRESYQKLELLFEMLPVGVSVFDQDQQLVKYNPALEKMMGISSNQNHGKRHLRVDGSPMPVEEFPVSRVFNGEAVVDNVETGIVKDDDTLIWTQISAAECPATDWKVAVVTTDITERKQLADKERDQRMLAEALRDTAAALISAVDLASVMNTILENVARVVPHDAANIMLIEGDLGRVAYWRGYPPERVAFFQHYRFPLTSTLDLRQMLDTRAPFLIPNTEEYDGWIQEPDTVWVKSYVAVPIRSRDAVIGFLNVDSGTPGFFTEEHVQRLQAFGDQASIAIERAQLYEEIRHHAAELEQRVKERTDQLNQTLQHIEAILNSSNDIIILCRPDGTISQVNPAFNRTFKCSQDAALFQPLTRLVHPDHVPLLEQTFQEVITTFRSRRLEITVHCEGHASFEADAVLSPIIEPTRHLSGVVCSLRDITRRKQMEDHLRHMLKHEMELSELKSRYVSMAAHDLRNPLAVIQSAVSLIHQYGDRLTKEKQEEKYSHIQTNINVMVDMLDDILTLGKVESGKLSFEPDLLDVGAFCKNIAAEMRQTAATPQIINFSSQGDYGPALLDAKLLRHILGNLLSNAIKYSPEERPIAFEMVHEPDQIMFRIRDQGIGIPEEDQEQLFETFHRAGNARQIPGTGLGLAIVKQSVELHGGTITFESQEGRGTTFTVVIPQITVEKIHEKDSGD